jgi:tRNA (guanine37-N1)-methyltransferase
MLRIDVISIFPDLFGPYVSESMLGLAVERGLLGVHTHDLRDYTTDKHRSVDDRPYGGGPGMVMRPGPIFDALEAVAAMAEPEPRVILLSPQGRTFTQPIAGELAREQRLALVCGRYEGFDERVREGLDVDEISIGDFVLTGGELPALVIIDAVARLVPGVLGHEDSARCDSFAVPGLLDHPQYTRPAVFRGMAVPEVLLSGHHAAVHEWRRERSAERTRERRPDLLSRRKHEEETD